MFDVVVIGGGVIGGTILRELTKYCLDVCLVEKEHDVCMGQSKANSGIVHAGFDAKENSLKAKFNVLGNKMMEEYAKELGVKFKKNGALVVAFSNEDLETLKVLKERGEKNGVENLEIIGRYELKKLEPNISNNALGALLAKDSGIICPYGLTIASIGNAMDNGAKLLTEFEVNGIKDNDGSLIVCAKDGREIETKIVINCAGLGSGEISCLANDEKIVKGRRGQYILLDKESGDFVSHTLFFAPTKLGKGILVTQTVDNNILLGPTAEELENPTTQTDKQGLDFVIQKVNQMVEKPPLFNTITSFAGVRAYTDKGDFIIEESKVQKRLINCVGIESPGLTSAPAIAKHVVENLVSKHVHLVKNRAFNGKRKADYFFKDLSIEEKNEIIKKDSSYGKIVCRCEQITEGEIIRAIHDNPPARDIDAIKRRTRSGMGRCQGGFCQPQIVEILARELNIPVQQVLKSGKQSNLVFGRSK